jgi:Arc/MetJ-type ribon-helix-helix transcriptional regulator
MEMKTIRITIRLPESLHEKLTTAAADGSRSINSEIVRRVELTFDDVDDTDTRLEQIALRVCRQELERIGLTPPPPEC